MPQLAAFPKAFMDPLCVDGSMSLRQWIELGATLGVEGLEFYAGFLDLQHPGACAEARRMAADHGRRSRPGDPHVLLFAGFHPPGPGFSPAAN